MAQNEESRVSKLVRIFVDQLQAIEDAAADVRFLQRLSYATGAQLDGLGELVGEARLGRTDAEYKTAIYFRMFLNAGHGEPELLIQALKTLTQSSYVKYMELHPAKVYLEFNGTEIPGGLKSSLQSLCPAGVDLSALVLTDADAFIFTGEGITLPDTDGLGFSSTAQVEGGKISGLVL